MNRKWLAGLLAAVMTCGGSLPVFAASPAVISKSTENETQAAAYQYRLFDPENSSRYVNEVYCSVSKFTVQADNGNFYTLITPSELESGDFTRAIQTASNAQLIKGIDVAKAEMQKLNEPSYCVKLSESAVLDQLTMGFTVRYTAKSDTVLAVREAGKKTDTKLTVKNGAKLSFNVKLTVDYSKLIQFDVTPRYADALDSIRKNPWPTGVSGDVLSPAKGDDSDYVWSSIGRICAEVNANGNLTYAPKLSTLWDNGTLKKQFSKGTAFVRSFAENTPGQTVTLTLTNPFLTLDGDESTPHGKLSIYEYKNGKLTNITKQFRYTTDSDGMGAFITTTSHLGTYIISDVKAQS